MMCARVADLGGIFRPLARGGLQLESDLRLIVVKPPAQVGLPAWFAFGSVGMHSRNPWLETVRVSEFRCMPITQNRRIHTEADGEWLGHLPMSVRLVPQAISLLLPENIVTG